MTRPPDVPRARTARTRRRRPVPAGALRGFEAAARRLSFTLAADELSLTQSSVSRQIAALEHQVGKALFTRRTRALALTSEGAQLHAAVTQALAVIDRCVEAIRGTGQPPRVSLSTYASFASLWLVPRLAEFRRTQPQIEIRIDATDRLIDLRADGIDVAIRRCQPRQVAAMAGVTELCEEFVTPALSPHLLERHGAALTDPAELARLPLIDMDEHWPSGGRDGWAAWFERAGVAPSASSAGRLTFGYIDQAVQAAIRGQGVVMGRTPLLEDTVAAGQLVAPFPALRLASGLRYYLIVNPERAEVDEVAAFSRWVADEFARGPRRSS